MIGNVLVISYYFPPMALSGVQRTLKFVKYLHLYEWNPIVLTTSNPVYYAFDDSLLDDMNNQDIKIYRTEKDPTQKIQKLAKNNKLSYPSRSKELMRKYILQTLFQPDSRRPWLKHALEKGRQIINENKIDMIYVSAPPFTSFLVAQKLSREFSIPFITDYRDLWLDNAYYIYATPFHKRYARKLEAKVLNETKHTIVTSRGMKQKLIERYNFMAYDDVTIIPHGYDSEDFQNLPEHKKGERCIFTHAGLFPDDLTPKYFLKAVAKYLKANPWAKEFIELRFAGLMRKKHINYIKKYKLQNNTKVLGYIPHLAAVEELNNSDVLWMMLPNDIATPSRLYEYIGSLRPLIISTPKGFIRSTAEQTEIAICTASNDVNAIAGAIEKYMDLWKINRLPKGSKSFAEKFDRKILTGDLARVLTFGLELDID